MRRDGGGGGGRTRRRVSIAAAGGAGGGGGLSGKPILVVPRGSLPVPPGGTRGGKVMRTVSFLGPFKSLMGSQKMWEGKAAGTRAICHELTFLRGRRGARKITTH